MSTVATPSGEPAEAIGRRLTPDERFERALAAEESQRRNRPTGLLLVSLLLLAGGLLWLASAWSGRAAAASEAGTAEFQLGEIEQNLIDLEFLRLRTNAAPADPDVTVVPESQQPFSVIEQIARETGIDQRLAIPQGRRFNVSGAPGVSLVSYGYTINDGSLESLLNFVRRVDDELTGMAVRSIEITPREAGWTLEVTFQRYERNR